MVLRVLPYAVALGFLILGLVSAHAWLRQRDPIRAALAWSSGLLGLTALAERVHALTGYTSRLLENATIVLFLTSGYALLLLRHRVMPLRHRTRALTAAIVGGVALLAILAASPVDPALPRAPVQLAAEVAIVLAWSGCVLEPIYRLWRTATRLPAVQRARLRSLSFGYGGLLLVLTVAFITNAARESPAFVLTVNLVALLLLPVLYAAFIPPRWLRRLWRAREEEAMESAVDDLVSFHPDTTSLGGAAVSWAARLVGGDGAVLKDPSGAVVASHGEGVDALPTRPAPERAAVETVPGDRYAIRVPVSMEHGTGILEVVAGAFTPLFGTDEVATLVRYGKTLRGAIQRVKLVEQLREATARSSSMLDAASDLGQGVVVVEGYRVVYANDAYTQITGYTLGELRELRSLMDLAAPDQVEELVERAKARRAGIATEDHYETAMIRKDGRRIEVEVSVKGYQREGSTMLVTLVRDIGDRKRAERALRTAYEREREAAERLRSVDEMKNAFLTAVSHELRTPLTAILGFSRTLQDHGDSLPRSDREDLLERIARGAMKLERLLEDLLDLDRLHRNQLTVMADEVDVAQLVKRVVDEADIGARELTFAAAPAVASVDPSKVERIVENLLTNAAKYSPPDAPIHVGVASSGGGVLIYVEDRGPGVPAELRAKIFRPFERGTHRDDHAPGVGIGLSLVTLFAELHGGRAWVDDGTQGGAAFKVWLPNRDRNETGSVLDAADDRAEVAG
ncbi:MAG TPA: PAS domain-containing sensor histidine kinase [Actinomycetota bacterium]|nr:PAS domain-containing sensor histidine kinase [Actinomycetota bacterium]